MVNKDLNYDDGFQQLLKLQQDSNIPAGLESMIMHKIEIAKQKSSFPIRFKSIFIFGLLSSLYVAVAILSTYFYPKITELQDLKIAVGLGILAYCLYELNDILLNLFNRLFKKRELKF
jgi:hypothetical protein